MGTLTSEREETGQKASCRKHSKDTLNFLPSTAALVAEWHRMNSPFLPLTILLVVVVSFTGSSTMTAPYVILKTPKPFCVSVEVPADVPVRVLYSCPDLGEWGSDGGLRITVDREGQKGGWNVGGGKRGRQSKARGLFNGKFGLDKSLVSEDATKEDGQIAFRSHEAGVHKICATVLLAGPDRPVRMYLAAETGEDSDHYEKLGIEGHLNGMQVEVVKLNDQMEEILAEADYMKGIEVEFHNQSINMNSASKWWPIIQICILIMMGVVQYVHLRTFFQKKKLV